MDLNPKESVDHALLSETSKVYALRKLFPWVSVYIRIQAFGQTLFEYSNKKGDQINVDF